MKVGSTVFANGLVREREKSKKSRILGLLVWEDGAAMSCDGGDIRRSSMGRPGVSSGDVELKMSTRQPITLVRWVASCRKLGAQGRDLSWSQNLGENN